MFNFIPINITISIRLLHKIHERLDGYQQDVNNDLIISIRNNCPVQSMMQHRMSFNNENAV